MSYALYLQAVLVAVAAAQYVNAPQPMGMPGTSTPSQMGEMGPINNNPGALNANSPNALNANSPNAPGPGPVPGPVPGPDMVDNTIIDVYPNPIPTATLPTGLPATSILPGATDIYGPPGPVIPSGIDMPPMPYPPTTTTPIAIVPSVPEPAPQPTAAPCVTSCEPGPTMPLPVVPGPQPTGVPVIPGYESAGNQSGAVVKGGVIAAIVAGVMAVMT